MLKIFPLFVCTILSVTAYAQEISVLKLPPLSGGIFTGGTSNQRVAVGAGGIIYVAKEMPYTEIAYNSSDKIWYLYAISGEYKNWEKVSFTNYSTPSGLYPWGISGISIPRSMPGKVYTEQQYLICSSDNEIALNFSCESTDQWSSGLINTYYDKLYFFGYGKDLQVSQDGGVTRTTIKIPDKITYSYFTALDVSNSSQPTIIAGTDSGEIWVTKDSGLTWNAARRYAGNNYNDWHSSIKDIYFVQDNPQTAWASSPEGILKSNDGGDTWEVAREGVHDNMAADKSGKYVLAIQNGKIIYTTDAGINWVEHSLEEPVYDISSSATGTIFAAISINSAYIISFEGSTPGVIPGEYYSVIYKHSGKCQDVRGADNSLAAEVIQWPCHGGDNQKLQLVDKGNSYYSLVYKHSGLCTDVYGGGTGAGEKVIQWPCHGGDNQLFTLEDKGGGYYSFKYKHSGQCIDVFGGGTADAANVIQWPCHGGDNQLFRFAD